MAQNNRPIELIIVGDRTVGKTSICRVYTTGSFPEVYRPLLDNYYDATIECDSVKANLILIDTEHYGEEHFDRFRILSYPQQDGVLMCFSVDNSRSYENIVTQWHPEIRHHCPRVPIILVGTKTDLRETGNDNFISEIQGKEMATKIEAIKYMECSAKENNGINEVFAEAVLATLSSKDSNPSSSKRQCFLL